MTLSIAKTYNKRLYGRNKKGRVRKHGNLRAAVFHPSKPQLVGFVVKRPDFLLMIKRKNRFIAFDCLTIDDEGNHIADLTNADAWDRAACRRLGIDYDSCVIWEDMPVRTQDGEEVGTVADVAVDYDTGKVISLSISEGSINRALLGSADIAVKDIRGYKDGAIVVSVSADEVKINGGVAAKAGEAWAKGSHTVSQAEEAATEKAVEAIDKGGEAAGKAVAKVASAAKAKAAEVAPEGLTAESAGKAAGKHLKAVGGMFGEFKKEFDKANK